MHGINLTNGRINRVWTPTCAAHNSNSLASLRDCKLVGGIPTPLKHMSSSVGMVIPNIWKVIKFHGSKPPTSKWCQGSFGPTCNGQMDTVGGRFDPTLMSREIPSRTCRDQERSGESSICEKRPFRKKMHKLPFLFFGCNFHLALHSYFMLLSNRLFCFILFGTQGRETWGRGDWKTISVAHFDLI